MKIGLLWCCTIYLCLATGLLLLRAALGTIGIFSDLNPETVTREQLYHARELIERGMWIDAGIVAVGVVGLVIAMIWMTDQPSQSD